MKFFSLFGPPPPMQRQVSGSTSSGGGAPKFSRSRSHNQPSTHAKRSSPTQIANSSSWQDEYEKYYRRLAAPPPLPAHSQQHMRPAQRRHRTSSSGHAHHSYPHQHTRRRNSIIPHDTESNSSATSSETGRESRRSPRSSETLPRAPRYVPASRRLLTVGTDSLAKIGDDIDLTEADALKFLAENTSIPVPKVLSSYEEDGYAYIMMEKVEGETLTQAWPTLSSWAKASILSDLRGYVSQMRRLRPGWTTKIGSVSGGGAVDLRYSGEVRGGPFGSEDAFNRWQLAQLRNGLSSFNRDKFAAMLKTNHRFVFSHGDLNLDNVIVRDGKIVAVVNWEYAGWYPEYWDYCKTAQHMCTEELYPVLKEVYETAYLEEYAVQESLEREMRHGGF